jgi:hypothetical protein
MTRSKRVVSPDVRQITLESSMMEGEVLRWEAAEAAGPHAKIIVEC